MLIESYKTVMTRKSSPVASNKVVHKSVFAQGVYYYQPQVSVPDSTIGVTGSMSSDSSGGV